MRFRIDGVLKEMVFAPKEIQSAIISRLKIMSEMDIAERRKPQDGRLSVMSGGTKIDLRVSRLPTVWGEKIVMRVLDNTAARMVYPISVSPRPTSATGRTPTRSPTACSSSADPRAR